MFIIVRKMEYLIKHSLNPPYYLLYTENTEQIGLRNNQPSIKRWRPFTISNPMHVHMLTTARSFCESPCFWRFCCTSHPISKPTSTSEEWNRIRHCLQNRIQFNKTWTKYCSIWGYRSTHNTNIESITYNNTWLIKSNLTAMNNFKQATHVPVAPCLWPTGSDPRMEYAAGSICHLKKLHTKIILCRSTSQSEYCSPFLHIPTPAPATSSTGHSCRQPRWPLTSTCYIHIPRTGINATFLMILCLLVAVVVPEDVAYSGWCNRVPLERRWLCSLSLSAPDHWSCALFHQPLWSPQYRTVSRSLLPRGR